MPMFSKLFRLGRVRLFSSLGILMVAALILLDEVLRRGYLFRPSDILALRITHEKWVVALFMLGFYLQYRKAKTSRKKRNELPRKI